MDANRSGAWALVAGSVLACLVFAFHPSHVDSRPLFGAFTLSQIVHATAIVAAPLLLYGMWSMAEWLGLRSGAVRLGLVLAAFAMLLTANAAVVSSFVTPAAAQASMPSPHPAAAHRAAAGHSARRPAMPPLVQVSVALNRGLAQAHVATLSLALLLFAWGLRARSTTLAAFGGIVGAYPLAWQLSGTFWPSTHSMPLIVFPQSAWLIAVAMLMLRTTTSPECAKSAGS
jgi:hypothetical protein